MAAKVPGTARVLVATDHDRAGDWRNAIAQQDWTRVGGDPNLRLAWVRWRRAACQGLARSLDRAVGEHLHAMAGHRP